MNFGWEPEQQALREMVRAHARKELAGGYLERARRDVFPTDVHRRLADLGLLALLLPESRGGQGGNCTAVGVAVEELAYADFNAAFLTLMGAAASALAVAADSASASVEFERVAKGELVLAVALTEPDAGSDLASVRTTALRKGRDWVIEGEKASISLALASDLAVVLARLDGQERSGVFLVPLDAPGVSRHPTPDPGFRPIGRGSLHFDAVVVPDELRVAHDERGLQAMLHLFDFTRPALGLMCVGAAQASLDEAAEYAKQRHAFGQPIAKFQGVAFPLAEHHSYVHCARLICYEALWRRDHGLGHTREAAIAKWLGPQISRAAAHEAALLHGNIGYSTEAPYIQRMLDIMSLEIGDGTAQIQKSVIARELLGREFRPY
jgi:cyclohexanecarboxyl-CoA dehydrogenase